MKNLCTTSNTKYQIPNLRFSYLLVVIALLFLSTSLSAQIKVWPNNTVSIGTAYNSPTTGFTDIWRSTYFGPTNATSGCSITKNNVNLNTSISVAHLPEGVYFLKCSTINYGIKVFKFIKN